MRSILALLALLSFSNLAVAATVEEDVQRYVQIFSGDKRLHNDAADTFSWMGLSDTRVFDIIERRLLEDADASRNNNERNRVARYIRSLGFSGQSKYEPTIGKFVGDRPYERFAKNALIDLPDYRKWNPIISNRSTFDPKLSDDVNRISNMLRSDDLLLQRVGAKRVYFVGNKDDTLLGILEKQVQASYARTDLKDRLRVDSVCWMVKALGSSRNPKYEPLIEEVAQKGVEQQVVRHAMEALSKYYDKPLNQQAGRRRGQWSSPGPNPN